MRWLDGRENTAGILDARRIAFESELCKLLTLQCANVVTALL